MRTILPQNKDMLVNVAYVQLFKISPGYNYDYCCSKNRIIANLINVPPVQLGMYGRNEGVEVIAALQTWLGTSDPFFAMPASTEEEEEKEEEKEEEEEEEEEEEDDDIQH